VTPEHEAYPGATSWGTYGWTTHTLAQAQMLLAELAARRESPTSPEAPREDLDEEV